MEFGGAEFEGPGEGSRVTGEGDLKGPLAVGEGDGGGEEEEELGLGGLVEGEAGFGGEGTNAAVDERAEGFDEVIGEGEGVGAAVVADAEGGEEAGGDDGAGDGGAEDGVAVVEEVVGGLGIAVAGSAAEGRGEGGEIVEQGGPVEACGVGLGVGGVAAADGAGEGEEAGLEGGVVVEVGGLGADFGGDEGGPEALAGGAGGGELGFEAGEEFGVFGDGEEEAGGEVISAADDERGAVLCELIEECVGVGGFAFIDDEEAEVFEGDGSGEVGGASGEGGARGIAAEDEELAVSDGEVAGLTGDFDVTADQGGGSISRVGVR